MLPTSTKMAILRFLFFAFTIYTCALDISNTEKCNRDLVLRYENFDSIFFDSLGYPIPEFINHQARKIQGSFFCRGSSIIIILLTLMAVFIPKLSMVAGFANLLVTVLKSNGFLIFVSDVKISQFQPILNASVIFICSGLLEELKFNDTISQLKGKQKFAESTTELLDNEDVNDLKRHNSTKEDTFSDQEIKKVLKKSEKTSTRKVEDIKKKRKRINPNTAENEKCEEFKCKITTSVPRTTLKTKTSERQNIITRELTQQKIEHKLEITEEPTEIIPRISINELANQIPVDKICRTETEIYEIDPLIEERITSSKFHLGIEESKSEVFELNQDIDSFDMKINLPLLDDLVIEDLDSINLEIADQLRSNSISNSEEFLHGKSSVEEIRKNTRRRFQGIEEHLKLAKKLNRKVERIMQERSSLCDLSYPKESPQNLASKHLPKSAYEIFPSEPLNGNGITIRKVKKPVNIIGTSISK